MKRNILTIILLTALLSCSHNQEHGDIHKPTPMSFSASIEPLETSTKTVLDGNSGTATRMVLWCPSDSIYVTDGTSSAKFINKEQSRTETAHFDGEITTGGTYYSLYPYQAVSGFSSSSFVLNLPSIQTYYSDGISSDSYPMVAQCDKGVFSFKNLCGILVLKLTGPATTTISSITFTGKDSKDKLLPVSGKGTVSVKYSTTPNLVMDSNAGTSVKLNCPAGVTLNPSTPTTFHIVLPPAVYQTFIVSVTDTKSETMYLNGSKPLTIKRSGRVTATSVEFDPVVPEDLSIDGTANCYIVSKAGKYKFKATVKGGSTESVGTPSSAEALWESFGTDVAPSAGDIVTKISYSNGYVTFSTPSPLANGNAVIAVKDASGATLWSWHIWVCDGYDPQAKADYYNNSSYAVMDRNLGATSATPGDVHTLGLLYQWGRKDPFLSGESIKSNSKKAKSTGNWPASTASTSSTGTFEYVVRNPMQYITYNNLNNDWYYTSDGTAENTRWQTTKGIYDPCPSLWQVPDGGPNGLWSAAFGSSQTITQGPWSGTGRGMNFGSSAGTGKSLGTTDPIWYPAAGYITETDALLTNVGNFGRYWSCTPNGKRGYSIYYNYSGEVGPAYGYDRAYGLSVRCIKKTTGRPTVTTSSVSSIKETTATCGGNITSDGGATVIARGVVWSTSQNPTVETHTGITSDGSSTGTFTSQLTGLSRNTRYYVRAYAKNTKGTSYGGVQEFYTGTSGSSEGYDETEYEW